MHDAKDLYQSSPSLGEHYAKMIADSTSIDVSDVKVQFLSAAALVAKSVQEPTLPTMTQIHKFVYDDFALQAQAKNLLAAFDKF